MEGRWRGVAVWLVMALIGGLAAVGTTGCGDDQPSAAEEAADSATVVETKDPEEAFAPYVELARNDPYHPMGAQFFVKHSLLAITEADCDDREIAVGHGIPQLQTEVTDWTFTRRLGNTPDAVSYYRNIYGEDCELDYEAPRIYADQLTRPHDPGARSAPPGVGFHLDLEDSARTGPPLTPEPPVYVERTEEGDSGVRLTYWMLFGMHAPRDGGPAHEGDWERVDVLLRRVGKDRYLPEAVQLGLDANGHDPAKVREHPWSDFELVDGAHPHILSAYGSHTMTAFALGDERCFDCTSWTTWHGLSPLRKQLWYGFGGAWGEVGDSDETTGPLGPHGVWPTDEQSAAL